MWQSVMLGLVGLHLDDEVDEVLWFREELELLGINEVAKLVLNLDDQLNHVETVEAVIREVGVQGDRGLLGRSEIVLNN